MRLDGKCGKITKRITTKKGKYKIQSVMIKLDSGKQIEIGVGLLSAPKKYYKMSSSKIKKEISKPFHGYKVGQRVCISAEEALYS